MVYGLGASAATGCEGIGSQQSRLLQQDVEIAGSKGDDNSCCVSVSIASSLIVVRCLIAIMFTTQ
jgi:hypothetical protein